jgi:radical SAM superfamily enzyme
VATLDELALDSADVVRMVVASRPDCSAGSLALLAGDTSEIVRRTVSLNLNTPLDAVLRLVIDEAAAIREQAVQHPVIPVG